MSSVEETYLRSSDRLLNEASAEVCPRSELADGRLTVLEALASDVGGWEVQDFWAMGRWHPTDLQSDPRPWADKLRASIEATPIPLPLALSALSRETLPPNQRRKTGAFYTDWRLAELLAGQSVPQVRSEGPWIDTACGTGVLLTAAAMAVPAGEGRDRLIRERLIGADLSARALRGALLSVASLTGDLTAIAGFARRLLQHDSLQSSGRWAQLAPGGAALVIGNPPWEKLKASRHELATSRGQVRHYGQSYDEEVDLARSRRSLLSYIEQVAEGTRLQGKGEHDLYKLFLELGMGLAAEGGVLAMLLPAGLIRAQGTERLRRELDTVATELSISVIENRARHFAIDTRFKFLSVVARVGTGRSQPITLRVANRAGVLPVEPVKLPRTELRRVRPDLSIPEVKSSADWKLFVRLARNSVSVGDPAGPWRPRYRREVDMTLDQKQFRREACRESLPLLEGRHVAQYRWRAKSYQRGEGRAAIWHPEPLGGAKLKTQWHVPISALHPASVERTELSRIGFCDITGQTNERSLLVARVPADVVCGNKVPTLALPEGGAAREDLFLALTNSFAVDWVMRRLVTTTVNFFLLDSLPLPLVDESSAAGRELIALARRLSAVEASPIDMWEVAHWRARIDVLVATAWGLTVDDAELILQDFPLIDRGQPALPDEERSTVTTDFLLAELAKNFKVPHRSIERLQIARMKGAIPYVPAQFA